MEPNATDNNPLSHLHSAKLGANERRWAAFDFELKYRSGRSYRNADAFSRQYMSGSTLAEQALPGTLVPISIQQAPCPDSMVPATKSVVSVLSSCTLSNISSLQESDPLLHDVLVFWRRQVQSSPEEKRQVPRAVLALLCQWDHLVEREGVLYQWVFRPDGGRKVYNLSCLHS